MGTEVDTEHTELPVIVVSRDSDESTLGQDLAPFVDISSGGLWNY
jgi:hypothetical protein